MTESDEQAGGRNNREFLGGRRLPHHGRSVRAGRQPGGGGDYLRWRSSTAANAVRWWSPSRGASPSAAASCAIRGRSIPTRSSRRRGARCTATHAYVQYQRPRRPRRLPLVLWHGGGRSPRRGRRRQTAARATRRLSPRLDGVHGRPAAPGPGRARRPRARPSRRRRATRITVADLLPPRLVPGVLPRYAVPDQPGGGRPVLAAGHAQHRARTDSGRRRTASPGGRAGRLVRPDRPGRAGDSLSEQPVRLADPDPERRGAGHRVLRAHRLHLPVRRRTPSYVPGDTHPFVVGITTPIIVEPAEFSGSPGCRSRSSTATTSRVIPTRAEPLPRHRPVARRGATGGSVRGKINRRGGQAEVLHLPDVGLYGNTHFPFSDLNNVEVADLLSRVLRLEAPRPALTREVHRDYPFDRATRLHGSAGELAGEPRRTGLRDVHAPQIRSLRDGRCPLPSGVPRRSSAALTDRPGPRCLAANLAGVAGQGAVRGDGPVVPGGVPGRRPSRSTLMMRARRTTWRSGSQCATPS